MKRTLIIDGKPVEVDDGQTFAAVEPWWARVARWWGARNKTPRPPASVVGAPTEIVSLLERNTACAIKDYTRHYKIECGDSLHFPPGTTRSEAFRTLNDFTHLPLKTFADLVNEANKLPESSIEAIIKKQRGVTRHSCGYTDPRKIYGGIWK